MDKIINLFFAPKKVFESLKEKPNWVLPFIVVLVVLAITSALTISFTKETAIAQQEEILKERGLTDEQIQQAKQFMAGPAASIVGAISAAISIAIVLLIFAAILNLLIPPFGGTASFKNVFSVISWSALVKIPGSILRLILIAITKSLYVTTSLVLVVPNLAKKSFAYQFLSGLDFFIFWEMMLVAYGLSKTNNLKRDNAYILVFAIWIISILIGVALNIII